MLEIFIYKCYNKCYGSDIMKIYVYLDESGSIWCQNRYIDTKIRELWYNTQKRRNAFMSKTL